MAELILDTVRETSFEEFGLKKSVTRTGLIVGVDTSPPNDAFSMLNKALSASGVPPLFSTSGAFTLRQRRVVALAGDVFALTMTYSTPEFPAGDYILRRTSRLMQHQTNMVPGTQVPIRVGWTDPVSGETVPEDNCTIIVPRAVKVLLISGTRFDPPPVTNEDQVNKVNDATWQRRAKGCWLLSLYDTEERGDGSIQVTASADSIAGTDWSTYAILQNKQTGKFVKVEPAAIAALVASPYAYGYVAGNGVVRVGPHETTNFTDIFGF